MRLSISDMMASQLFENEYFIYELKHSRSNNTDMFTYIESGLNVEELGEFSLVTLM